MFSGGDIVGGLFYDSIVILSSILACYKTLETDTSTKLDTIIHDLAITSKANPQSCSFACGFVRFTAQYNTRGEAVI